jgi:hypothetical protein
MTLIYLELILVQGKRQGCNFNLLLVDTQFFPTLFFEEAVFSPVYVLSPLSRIKQV